MSRSKSLLAFISASTTTYACMSRDHIGHIENVDTTTHCNSMHISASISINIYMHLLAPSTIARSSHVAVLLEASKYVACHGRVRRARYHCVFWWYIAVHCAVGQEELSLEIFRQCLICLVTLMPNNGTIKALSTFFDN